MTFTVTNPIWRPYTQEHMALPPLKIKKAEGAYLYTEHGQKIFDGISSWWLNTHGHCHPAIVEAIQKQAARVDQVTFANFTHEPAGQLAELLIQMTPAPLSRVFFSDNGSTAVEVALKMAVQANAQRGCKLKTKFLSFEHAYHGDTVGAMSVSGKSPFNHPYRKSLFDVLHAKHPTSFSATVEDYVKDFARIIELESATLAGVIIEPLIQGAGGMIVWPEEAVRFIARTCKHLGVYLIFDEVMTGFGRTGELFAMDKLGIVPDFLCLSKGLTGGSLPLAATLVQEEIYEAFLSTYKERMLFHGHSFTGNSIACAAAVASLQLFQDPQTLMNLKRIQICQAENLTRFREQLDFVETRCCGTMAAVEIPDSGEGYLSSAMANITSSLLLRGLFLRPLGNVLYVLPPYCSTNDDLNGSWDTITSELSEMEFH